MADRIEIDLAKPQAFLSYTRFDDKFLSGGISALREALELAVQARTGRRFNIFQDVDDIKPGDVWRNKLDRAIEAAQLFIPILTPSFFESAFCRSEAEAFLAYEARAGRDDLVLPIYLIDTPKLDDANQRAADDLASRLHERQYADWRLLRYKLGQHDIRQSIDDLAGSIATAIERNGDVPPPPPKRKSSSDFGNRLAALEAKLEDRDRAFEEQREISQNLASKLAEREIRVEELQEEASKFQSQAKEARRQSRDEKDALLAELAVERRQREEVAERASEEAVEGEKALRDEIDRLKAELAATKRATREASVQTSGAAPEWSTASTLTKLLPRIPALRFPEALQRRGWQVLGGICGAVILGAAAWQYVQSPLRGLQAGDVFQDCDLCPEMVVIPAGHFIMGARESEAGSQYDERPRHTVHIESLAIGKYEVTFAEWDACVAVGGCDRKPSDQGWGRGSRPVINVSWDDAQQYVAWLSRETGKIYRLPSEAEWEYSARAFSVLEGSSAPAYAFGNSLTKEQANFYRNVGSTTEVGSYPPNAWGLHDMHGNVWEWVEDSWHVDYRGAPSDGSAWTLAGSSEKVLRGGSWEHNVGFLRSANRHKGDLGDRGNTYGFRVAKSLKP